MTGTSSIPAMSAPLPVLPLAEPAPLSYSSQKTLQSPMIRTGALLGCLWFTLTGLTVGGWAEAISDSSTFRDAVHLVVPMVQLMGAGAGITLVLIGRRFASARVGLKFKLALTVNLVTILMAGSELKSQVKSSPRTLVQLSSSI